MKKLYGILLVFLVVSIAMTTSVAAGWNVEVPEGKYVYKIRYDFATFKAPCAKSGQVSGNHINLEVWKVNTKLANWHIGWDNKCVVAYDTESKKCVRVCYDKGGKGKLGDLLKALDLSNSAIKAIQASKEAIRQFDKLGLSAGASAYIVYYSAIKAFIAAAAAAMLYVIYKIISCYYTGCAA